MDTPLKNDVSTIYNNGYEPEDETPVDHAYTIIGDHQFIKTDGDTSKALSGAKFVVKNKIDPNKVTYLKQDPTTKAVTWIADKSKATEFVSGSDGKFQIEGLQYTYDVDFDKQGNPTITDKKSMIMLLKKLLLLQDIHQLETMFHLWYRMMMLLAK